MEVILRDDGPPPHFAGDELSASDVFVKSGAADPACPRSLQNRQRKFFRGHSFLVDCASALLVRGTKHEVESSVLGF